MNKKLQVCILGLGWLGGKLGQALVKEGYRVLGTKASSKETWEVSLKETRISIFSWQLHLDLSESLMHCDVYVINIPPSASTSYVEGMQRLFSALPTRALVIFCSSTSVYGSSEGITTEAVIPKPTSKGGIAKYQCEKILMKSSFDHLIILRLAGLIGQDRHPIFSMVGKKVRLDEHSRVNLVHRVDGIAIITMLIDSYRQGNLKPNTSIYNVCADEHPQKVQYYSSVAQKNEYRIY